MHLQVIHSLPLWLNPALSCKGFNQVTRCVLYFTSVKVDARLNLDLNRGKNKSVVVMATIYPRQTVCKSKLLPLIISHIKDVFLQSVDLEMFGRLMGRIRGISHSIFSLG